MKFVLSIFAIGIAVAAAFYFRDRLPFTSSVQAQKSERSPPTSPGLPTKTESAVQGIGYVEPITEVRRLAFQSSGVVAESSAEIGRRYKKGDVLISLINSEERAAVYVAERMLQVSKAKEAQVNRGVHQERIDVVMQKVAAAKERLKFYEFEYARNETLMAKNSVSAQEVQRTRKDLLETRANIAEAEAEAAYLKAFVLPEDRALAAAEVQLAEGELSLARERLAKTSIKAPFDGEVLEILKREGEHVDVGEREPALLFADLSRVRIRAEIDERHVRNVRKGQKARIFGRNLHGSEYEGVVDNVKPLMGQKSVFTRSSTERKDLDVIQLFLSVPSDFHAPVGLRVDIAIVATPTPHFTEPTD